ncbi:hypothetical protein D3C73_1472630 [compost metagenome]
MGLYHFRNGNISGSIKLFSQGVDKLNDQPEVLYGIRAGKLVEESKAYISKLERISEEPFEFYDLDIEVVDPELAGLVEEMRLNPPVHED